MKEKQKSRADAVFFVNGMKVKILSVHDCGDVDFGQVTRGTGIVGQSDSALTCRGVELWPMKHHKGLKPLALGKSSPPFNSPQIKKKIWGDKNFKNVRRVVYLSEKAYFIRVKDHKKKQLNSKS